MNITNNEHNDQLQPWCLYSTSTSGSAVDVIPSVYSNKMP